MDASDRLLLRTSWRGWWTAALAAVALLDATIAIVLPSLLGGAVDAALGEATGRGPLVLLGVLVAAASGAEMLRTALGQQVTAGATAGLRHRLVARVLGMGLSAERRFATGDLVARVLQGAGQSASLASRAVGILANCLTGLGGIVALGLIDWRLAAIVLVGMPVAMLIARVFTRKTTDISSRYQELHGRLAARFVDAVGGARTIRFSGTLGHEVDRVLEPLPRLRDTGKEMWEAQRQLGWQVSAIAPLFQVGVIAVAGVGVANGRISPGQVLAAVAYLGLAMQLFGQATAVAQLGRSRAGARRVHEVLAGQAPVRGGAGALPAGGGRLELRGVRVGFDGASLLEGVDLDVPAGTTLAVVGSSGTGKSTVASVAGGLLEPEEGQVLLDGVPLRDLSPETLRAAVSFAFETPHLLGETVADMVGYADPPVGRLAVQEAIRDARAAAFVERLPQSYDTPLRDVALSGGERQRLGLARAVARGARLVILDDALSSLDTATEVEVAAALDRALDGATKLMVAHRVSTAARADLVAWLEGGRIRAVAPHERLWELGEYRALFGAVESTPSVADSAVDSAAAEQASG